MDRDDPKYDDDPATRDQQTPGWQPVVGTTYEPQDERPTVPEHDIEHDTSATHEHGNEDMTGHDKDATGYDRP